MRGIKLNPNQAGGAGGAKWPAANLNIISLQPVVRLTSNQAVSLSLSVVLNGLYKN